MAWRQHFRSLSKCGLLRSCGSVSIDDLFIFFGGVEEQHCWNSTPSKDAYLFSYHILHVEPRPHPHLKIFLNSGENPFSSFFLLDRKHVCFWKTPQHQPLHAHCGFACVMHVLRGCLPWLLTSLLLRGVYCSFLYINMFQFNFTLFCDYSSCTVYAPKYPLRRQYEPYNKCGCWIKLKCNSFYSSISLSRSFTSSLGHLKNIYILVYDTWQYTFIHGSSVPQNCSNKP